MLSVRACWFPEVPAVPCTGQAHHHGLWAEGAQEELSHALLWHQSEASLVLSLRASMVPRALLGFLALCVLSCWPSDTPIDVLPVVLSPQQPIPHPSSSFLKGSFGWQPAPSQVPTLPALAIPTPLWVLQEPFQHGPTQPRTMEKLMIAHCVFSSSTAGPFHSGSCSAEGKG